MTGVTRFLARLDVVRRRVLVHRRLLAALLTAAAVLLGFRAVQEPPAPGQVVVVARHDLAAGRVLASGDVRTTEVDADDAPAGVATATTAAVGRTLAAPLRRGEPVTDVRMVSRALFTSDPERVVVPVRLGDAAVVRLLRTGDQVDLVAGDPAGADAPQVVAEGARVVAVPHAPASSASSASGALVLLAVSRQEATRASVAGEARYLGVVFTH